MSEGIDAWRERQNREAAEKLDALLATVETRARPHGRLPKKIGTIVVDTGVKNGYQTEKATFTLRLDSYAGEWIAEHGDMLYVAKTMEALQAKMEQVGRVTLDLKWTRYIVISYEAESDKERCFNSWRSSSISLNDRRKRGLAIYGIRLSWEIVEFSEEFTVPGGEPKYMKREIDEDGDPQREQTVDSLPGGLVIHTPEREAILKSIISAFTALDARMIGLLRGDTETVGAALDQLIGGQFLLTDGPQPPNIFDDVEDSSDTDDDAEDF